MYKYELGKYDVESIISFTSKGWFRNVRGEKVPHEPSWFDDLTDDIVKYLKVYSKINLEMNSM